MDSSWIKTLRGWQVGKSWVLEQFKVQVDMCPDRHGVWADSGEVGFRLLGPRGVKNEMH